MRPRRSWYFLLLTLLGLGTLVYGLIRGQTFWIFVGLAWLFVAITQAAINRRR